MAAAADNLPAPCHTKGRIMNNIERVIYEQEREEFRRLVEDDNYLYSVVYFDDDSEQHGIICDDFDKVIDAIQKLHGFRHINILRFNRSELQKQ